MWSAVAVAAGLALIGLALGDLYVTTISAASGGGPSHERSRGCC